MIHFLQKAIYPDLVATSGDYLRVWRVSDSDVRLECLLNNVSTNLRTNGKHLTIVCSVIKEFKSLRSWQQQKINLYVY